MTRGKGPLVAVLMLLAVFAVGGVAGVALERYGCCTKRTTPTRSIKRRRGGWIKRMRTQLQLSDQQAAKIKTIIGTYRPQLKAVYAPVRPQLKAIRKKMRDEIRAILKPAQQAGFEAMVKRYEERRRRRRMRRHGGK